MIRTRLFAALCAACFLLPAAANAHGGWYGPIAGGYGGYDAGYVYPYFYRVRSIPTPPYFALHPPVYYGPRLMYRPYGNSPFAYPSWYERQFDVVRSPMYNTPAAEPMFIINPYVNRNGQPGAEDNGALIRPRDARGMQFVANPHVGR